MSIVSAFSLFAIKNQGKLLIDKCSLANPKKNNDSGRVFVPHFGQDSPRSASYNSRFIKGIRELSGANIPAFLRQKPYIIIYGFVFQAVTADG